MVVIMEPLLIIEVVEVEELLKQEEVVQLLEMEVTDLI